MSTPLDLRIASDGTRTGTRLYAIEEDGTEREVIGATFISWHLDAQEGVASANVLFLRLPAHVRVPWSEVRFQDIVPALEDGA